MRTATEKRSWCKWLNPSYKGYHQTKAAWILFLFLSLFAHILTFLEPFMHCSKMNAHVTNLNLTVWITEGKSWLKDFFFFVPKKQHEIDTLGLFRTQKHIRTWTIPSVLELNSQLIYIPLTVVVNSCQIKFLLFLKKSSPQIIETLVLLFPGNSM